jgi:hypothetical protein
MGSFRGGMCSTLAFSFDAWFSGEGGLRLSNSINPATQCSKWEAIDADYKDSLTDLLKLSFHLRQDGVESALERSHRGGHLWTFLAEPLPARDCRIYVCGLALRLGIPIKGGRRREGIEVFPKHDALKPGRYGNATVDPVVQEVLRAQAQHAIEGVTFSGGEPMQQADSLLPLIQPEFRN